MDARGQSGLTPEETDDPVAATVRNVKRDQLSILFAQAMMAASEKERLLIIAKIRQLLRSGDAEC